MGAGFAPVRHERLLKMSAARKWHASRSGATISDGFSFEGSLQTPLADNVPTMCSQCAENVPIMD